MSQAPSAQAPLASPSSLTKAKELWQPSLYKPPQPAQQQYNPLVTAPTLPSTPPPSPPTQYLYPSTANTKPTKPTEPAVKHSRGRPRKHPVTKNPVMENYLTSAGVPVRQLPPADILVLV
jgi:hypothetical protein